jgi:hypothetical protein
MCQRTQALDRKDHTFRYANLVAYFELVLARRAGLLRFPSQVFNFFPSFDSTEAILDSNRPFFPSR